MREHAPGARDFANRRYRHRGVIDEVERARNRTKSGVRAKVEHYFGVIKRVFGFMKVRAVRYRGLEKNAHRLFVTCALANLFMVRRRLLRACQADSVRNKAQGNSGRPKPRERDHSTWRADQVRAQSAAPT